MEVQEQLALFYWMRLGSGVFVVISALMFVYAVLGAGRASSSVRLRATSRVTRDRRPRDARPSPVDLRRPP